MTINEIVKHCSKFNARPVHSGICKVCNGIFYRFRLDFQTDTGEYCSWVCSIEGQGKNKFKFPCSNCHKEIVKIRHECHGQKYFMCDKKCLFSYIIKNGITPLIK